MQMKYINVSKKFVASWANKGLGNWTFSNDDLVKLYISTNHWYTYG